MDRATTADHVSRLPREGSGQARLYVVRKPEPLLFGDVLLENHAEFKRSRGGATTASFLLLIMLFGTLTLLPLLFMQTLPNQQLLVDLIAPPPPPPPPPPAASPSRAQPAKLAVARSEVMTNSSLMAPSTIPAKVAMIKDDPLPPIGQGGVVGGVPGGIPGGQLGGVIGGIVSATPSAAVLPKVAAPLPRKVVRVSQGVSQGMLIFKPAPDYPRIARAARIQGQVVLRANIASDGSVINLQVISGHPMLTAAALDAVSQWKYRPFLLNGVPIEVETSVTVNFLLSEQ